jgi:hypothetical protein
MALTLTQVAVATTGQTPLASVPSGTCQVTLTNNDAANYVTVGDKNVTATHGFELDAGKSVTFSTWPGSTGMALYAVAHTAAVNVSVIISTAQ